MTCRFQSFIPRRTSLMLRPFAIACLVAVASLGWTGWATAAACSVTDHELTTQAEVDALGATGCDSVLGYLYIIDDTDITNLDSLASITSVGGDLNIAGNAALTNLNGLANLTGVGGTLYIYQNDALTNLDSLANITSVEGDLYIAGNAALTDLNGLTNITSLEGSLSILENTALTNIDGLTNLTSVGDTLYIYKNDALTNLDGLASLARVEDSLRIYRNGALINLDGLASLTGSIGTNLDIVNNDALTNLEGLANITSVEGYLRIEGNDTLTNLDSVANLISVADYLYIGTNEALTTLDGLANLTSVGDFLYIYKNDALTNLDGLANLTSVGDYLRIYDNGALTNLDGLVNLTSVGGDLVLDANYLASCEGVVELLGWPGGPPDDTVAGDIDIGNNGTGCDSIAEILASVSGATKPTITNAVAIGGGGIRLEFSPSSTTDALFSIAGYEASCIGRSADLSEAPAAVLGSTPVTRTLTVSGYDPVSILSDIEVDIDIAHPYPFDLHVTLTTPQGTRLYLWYYRRAVGGIVGTFPTTLTPYNTISSVGRQPMDGNWVLKVEDVSQASSFEGVLSAWGLRISENLKTIGSGSPITVYGAIRGRDYSCTVAPVTGLDLQPASDAVTIKSDFPAVPTITSADYEDGTIRLTVSVGDNGGADISEYAASCTDGTNAFTGTSATPTIEVTGLTNGTAYTCSASATNAVGTSGTSAPTDSITPEALPTGLPIWLLYETTK